MVDPALKGLYPAKSLSRFADVVALCVQVWTWVPRYNTVSTCVEQLTIWTNLCWCSLSRSSDLQCLRWSSAGPACSEGQHDQENARWRGGFSATGWPGPGIHLTSGTVYTSYAEPAYHLTFVTVNFYSPNTTRNAEKKERGKTAVSGSISTYYRFCFV